MLPIRSRSEFAYCTRPIYVTYPSVAWIRGEGRGSTQARLRRGVRRRRPVRARRGLYGVLRAEAQLARRTIGEAGDEPPPDATGWYGRGRPGPAIKIVLLGDSSAAGYGVERVEETPGALLASGAAERADRRVYLRAFAKVGARSSDLAGQLDRALPIEPDVAVILIGANDVTHRVRPRPRSAHLAEAVRRLKRGRRRGRGRHLPRPRHRQADPAAAQAGGPHLVAPARRRADDRGASRPAAGPSRSARSSGPEFAAAPALLFGPDQFHPSAAGYRSLAAVLLPSMLAALGLIPDDEAEPEALRGEGVLPDHHGRAAGRRTSPAPSSTAPRSPAGPRRPRPVGRAAAPPPPAAPRGRGARRGAPGRREDREGLRIRATR